MSKAVIEIFKDGSGKLQYSFADSGDEKIDSLAKVAVGSMQLYAKSGGNIQNLVGSLGGNLKQQLGQMLLGGMR